jgi:CBS domain-containing protein
MQVHELMRYEPPSVVPETPIEDGARLMRDTCSRALPVRNQDAVIGIVTAADIVTRYVADGRELQLIGSLMTPLPQTLAPSEPAEVAEALMDHHAIDHLPVCIEDGTLVGMLSRADLRRRFCRLSSLPRAADHPEPVDDLSEALAYLHEVRQGVERLERHLSGRRRTLVERESRRGRLRAVGPAGAPSLYDAS